MKRLIPIALLMAGCASAPPAPPEKPPEPFPMPDVIVLCPEPLQGRLSRSRATGRMIAACLPPGMRGFPRPGA